MSEFNYVLYYWSCIKCKAQNWYTNPGEWNEWNDISGKDSPNPKTTCLTWFPHLTSSWFIQVESNKQLAKNKRTDVWMHLKIGGTIQTFPRASVSNAAFFKDWTGVTYFEAYPYGHIFVVHRFHRLGLQELLKYTLPISALLELSGLTKSHVPSVGGFLVSFLLKPMSQPETIDCLMFWPSRELTYPTLGKGKSSSKCHFWGIC